MQGRNEKTPQALANDVHRPMPFQMPTRLADGLGSGSSLSGITPEYAPPDWVPRIRFSETDLGCF